MKNSVQWAGTIGDVAEGASDSAEALAGLSKAADGLDDATSSVTGFSLAFKGLGASLLSIAPVLGAIAGIAAVGGLLYLQATEFSRAVEKANESQAAYSSTASEVQSLNSEIQTTSDRIAEIEASGPLTITQKSELEQLKLQNAELQRQYELKQKVADEQADTAVEDAMEALKKQRTYDITQKTDKQQLAESDSFWDRMMAASIASTESQGISSTGAYVETDIVTATQNEVDALNKLKDTRDELMSQRKSASKEEKDSIDDQIDELDKEIDRYDTEVQNNLESLESLRKNFIDESTNTVKSNLNDDELDMYNQITDIIDAYTNTDKLQKQAEALEEIWKDDSFAQAQQDLVDAFRSGQDVSIEEITKEYPDLVAACDEAGISVETLREELMALAQSETGLTAIEEDFEQFKVQAVSAINSIDAINAALVNSFSGKGLSIEIDSETGELSGDLLNIASAYQNLEGYDAAALFEKTANGVHLNREALRALQAQQEAIQKEDFTNKQLALLQRYNDAVAELDSLTAGTDEYNAQQLVVDELSSQLELVNQLSAAYDGATSAYQKWVDAQSNGEDGDMYRTVNDTMIERGKELYEAGRYNTEEFRAIAQFYSNQDLSTASMEQVVRAYESSAGAINRYFTGDKQGIDNLIYDIQQKVPEAIQEVEDENGEVKLKFNLDDESVSDALGISQEALQTILRGASEYTDSIVLGNTSNIEELEAKLSEMSQKAEDAKAKLGELQSSGELSTTIDFDVDTSKLDEAGLEDRINELTDLKEEVKVKFGADSSEVEYVDQLLEEAELRKEILAQQSNVALSVDITGEDDINTLSEKLSSLPKDETSNVSINISDTSQLDSVVNQIEQVPEDTPVSFSFTVQNEEEADSLKAKIDELESSSGRSITYTIDAVDNTGNTLDTADETKTITVNEVQGTTVDVSDETKTVTVNYTKGTQESPDNKNAKVNYNKGSQENPDKKKAVVDYNRGSQESPASPKSAVVNYVLGTVEKPPAVTVKVNYDTSGAPSGSGPANGTAHFYGTAFAQGTTSGDWSLKRNESNALINELGSEIVVRNGKWFILNNGYPTFANLRKGDVVFNHVQSESLLKNGYVTGSHARLAYENSFAKGSAFSSGSWVFGNTGNGNLGGTGTTYTGSSTYNSSSSNASTKATQANTKAVEDNTKKTENLKDWIESLTSTISDNVSSLKDAIEDFEMHANQNQAIDKYTSGAQSYVNTLRRSANDYMSRANWLGLDPKYVKKITSGELNIEDIQDEDLLDKIEKYQDYYEKAKELNAEITEINRNIREAQLNKLDNIQDDYEHLVDLSDSVSSYYESVSDLSEQLNLVGDANALLSGMSAQVAIREALLNEEKELTDQLNQLVKDGYIGMYTDTWNEWQEEINGVKQSIIDTDKAIAELKENIIDIRFDGFENGLDDLEHSADMAAGIRDLLSSEGVYADDLSITGEGYAQLALMGTELVSAKQQVVNYSAAIDALNEMYKNGDLTQAQYNERLKEYQKGQLDAVKATQDARDAILDLVKDGIEKATEAMEEYIDKRKEALDKEKEYYDFQKQMSNQSTEINKIRSQIAVLEGDDSLEATAKRRKLNSQLSELLSEYEDQQKEHEYDVINSAYDETLDKFKENEEEVLHELETSLTAQNEAIANALAAVKDNYSEVYGVLGQLADQYQFELTDSLTSPWESAEDALKQYLDAFGKLNPDIDIDTNPIKPSAPDSSQTTPTTSEADKQVTDKSQTGTWIKQGNQWWYKHDDGSYTQNGWEKIDDKWYRFDDQGWMQSGWQWDDSYKKWYYLGGQNDGSMKTGWIWDDNYKKWYYLDGSGAMVTSQWIDGKYYVDHTGAMATNGYVKDENKELYYWVNGNGVWEPQWNATKPDLKKYKLYYSGGTRRAKDDLAFVDDIDGKLNMGSEVMITRKGLLGNFGGSTIFNEKQKDFLYNLSKNGALYEHLFDSITPNAPILPNVDNAGGGSGDITMNVDFTVQGDMTKEVFPGMKKVLKESFDYTVKQLRATSRKL